jgi:hypothetical protein
METRLALIVPHMAPAPTVEYAEDPPAATYGNNQSHSFAAYHSQIRGLKGKQEEKEKCLVVHSYPTLIPPLFMLTNNVVKKIGSHYTLSTISHIIGPSTQECDRNGMRVYNQAFLKQKSVQVRLQLIRPCNLINMETCRYKANQHGDT